MPGRYKPLRLNAVKHDPPSKILADIIRMEEEIVKRAEKLNQAIAAK